VADGVNFAIAGLEMTCPDQTEPELGAIEYQYLNGSKLYVGTPLYKFTWRFLRMDYAQALWAIYEAEVAGLSPTTLTGGYVTVTIPDFKNGGLRQTTAFMTRPTGTMGGDGISNCSVSFYNIHASSIDDAIANPEGSYMDAYGIRIGDLEYTRTTWQF
jgi:hypothetical protein